MQVKIDDNDVEQILLALEFVTQMQADLIEDESLSEDEVEDLIYQNKGCYKLFLAISDALGYNLEGSETIH